MSPSTPGLLPSTAVRKNGSKGYTISLETSVSSDVSPSRKMLNIDILSTLAYLGRPRPRCGAESPRGEIRWTITSGLLSVPAWHRECISRHPGLVRSEGRHIPPDALATAVQPEEGDLPCPRPSRRRTPRSIMT